MIGCAKTYGDGTKALAATDLTVDPGEVVVILGPSGCGKTTLLRLLSGLDRPDEGGRVLFNGKDVTAAPIEQRGVGIVFQSYALFPHMSVAGNIGYGLRVQRWRRPERAARVQEMLATAQLTELAGRRVDQLSGGQRQRVALARALAPRPSIILLDEPLTALDAGLREGLRAEIAAMIRAQGATAVYVTHDQAEALALGDRIVVMQKGAIAQAGTPREVYFRPASPYVAHFFGIVNELCGTVTEGVFHSPAGDVPVPASINGAGQIAFRPEALSPDENGPLAFTVRESVFEGTRQRLSLADPKGANLVAYAPGSAAIAPGESLRFRLDTSALLDAGKKPEPARQG
nr:ABC transporter ATP-binding protein [Afifella sp. IM 167]